MFIAMATSEVPWVAKSVNILPNNWKSGAPGGWPTSSLYAVAIYSPQSQKLTVCSIVERYTKDAIRNIAQPI